MTNRTAPPRPGELFVTDGGIETHLIFNLAQELPNFSAYVLARSDVLRD